MSTDDSISEDVSSSGPLSHCHVSANGDGGKESETSMLSSDGTSASGLAVSEGRRSASQTTGGIVEGRPMDITPACNKIRSLCLSTEEAFEQGKNLPFINPSSLETLRALVQEIRSSGETDPEMWKDCEGRWLHLFQLVEKQYQEQILAQQEQYQCQIQLIQDEIKALVQLQNRQASVQPHTDLSPTPVIKTPDDARNYIFSGDGKVTNDALGDNGRLAPPARAPSGSPSPPLHGSEAANPGEERATTMLSSGYGTLSAWEACPEPAGSPGEEDHGGHTREKHHWSFDTQATTVTARQQDFTNIAEEKLNSPAYQHRTYGTMQPLTSWAQRQKLRAKKSRAGQALSPAPVYEEQPHRRSPLETTDSQDQPRPTGPSSSSFPLRRSDSLISEASGLTYWRLHECELYRPLPDSFDSGACLLLQEASMSPTPYQELQLSLREIYRNKQRTEGKRLDWEGSITSSASSPQVLTLDPAENMRQSERTSGFTSPSHFSSPTFGTQPQLNPRVGTPLSPVSMVDLSPNRGDTDCLSETSSVLAAGPSPSKAPSSRGNASQAKNQPQAPHQHRGTRAPFASAEEEGSHSRTGATEPRSSSGAGLTTVVSPRMERASSLEDPVVLSLVRQNLREKHSRHVADLRAYYESEIQVLRDQLELRDLPQDLEKSNQALTERCKFLEKSLAVANTRTQELEAANSSLDKQLADWPARYAVAGAAVKSLQHRLDESKRSLKEKDALTARLKSRVRQLEEAALEACQEADEKEARREREYGMLQDLLGEYDSLGKAHEGAKNKLASAENKIVDADIQISELKRLISKLESQVKQLEHENHARARYVTHSHAQPSGAGLFHHPDLLLSPGKNNAGPDFTRRRSPPPPSPNQLNGGRKKTSFKRNPPSVKSSGSASSAELSSAAGSWRCASPPECEQSLPQTRHQEQSHREAASCAMTPMMKALIELEDTRATESRAPWVGSQRTTVGFVERRHKEPVQQHAGLQADGEAVPPGGKGPGGSAKSQGAREGTAALLRAQRSLSPESHRSSSLPPPAQRVPPTTPTKRETLLLPMSAKSSPKRCPSENYSTAFDHMMPREEHLLKRFKGQVDQRRHSLKSSSPRKRLQFTADREDGLHRQDSSVNPPGRSSQLGWEEQGALGGSDLQDDGEETEPRLLDKLDSLAEAEKLFDELTQEKLQIEAALSRMPGTGGRVSLQTRLDEVALENRLERLNRELGSIRMTLKRFHVLRSSANI